MSDSNQENLASTPLRTSVAALTLLPISTTPAAPSPGVAKSNSSEIEKNDASHASASNAGLVLISVNSQPPAPKASDDRDDNHATSLMASIAPISSTFNSSSPLISTVALPAGLKLPAVNGAGLSVIDLANLSAASTPSALFQTLANMDIARIASTISQEQLAQLAAKFGADADFQNLLSTGHLPTAFKSLPPAPSTTASSNLPTSGKLAPPVVKGLGLESADFLALLGAKSNGELFTHILSQTMDYIASHISQDQVNQIFSKFAADPIFQNFISTGAIPKALIAGALPQIESTLSDPSPLSVEIVGTQST